MDQTTNNPYAIENRIVFLCLALTWPVYMIGGLYVLGPVLGVSLTALVLARAYVAGTPLAKHSVPPVPASVWVWGSGMVLMLVALDGFYLRVYGAPVDLLIRCGPIVTIRDSFFGEMLSN